MWWYDIAGLAQRVGAIETGLIDPSAIIEAGALLDDREGPISIGARSKICAGAIVKGPISIGADCMIGYYSVIRGPAVLGDNVRVGYATEICQALVGDGARVGPMCFVAQSRIDEGAYLGALVRTSNHRLDQQPISVREGVREIQTGLEKLGCWIGAGAALGIQVIVLPGRVIAAGSTFEPRITIDRNLPKGHYRVRQQIELVGGRGR